MQCLGSAQLAFRCTDAENYEFEEENYDAPDGEGEDYDEEEITQEDCWTIISSFFEEKGLVRQQLESFDEFVHNTMQELVDENAELVLHQGDQFTGQEGDGHVSYSQSSPW